MATKQNDNKQFFFIILGVIIWFLFGYYMVRKNRIELEKNPKYTIGVIIRIYRQKGVYFRYKYSVNGVFYEDSQSLTIKKDLIKLGDKFEVKYADKNPSNSKLILKKRINY